MRKLIFGFLIFGLFWFTACSGSGGTESNASENDVGTDEYALTNYNGTYLTDSTIETNTCDDYGLSFYETVAISNISGLGFTMTDDDGSFSGTYSSTKDDGTSSYELDFFQSSGVACLGDFFTDEDNGDGLTLDFFRVSCLGSDYGCEFFYAKPTEE